MSRHRAQPQNGHTGQNGKTSLKKAIKGKKLSGWSSPLVPFAALPKFLQDNEYLLGHHRQQLSSYVECIKSSFRLHTETWNIWTHVIPCVCFLSRALYQIMRPRMELEVEHKLAFTPFFLGSVFCLGMSGSFHTLLCHSKPVHDRLNKLDYCGVIAMISLSTLTWLYYGFYCHTHLQMLYISCTLFLGAASCYIVTHGKFATPGYRSLRAGLFIGLGLTCGVPALHFIYLHGHTGMQFLHWMVLMAFLYLAGGVIYAARIPERLKPGMFDIWLHSHQILHLCVVGGAITCYIGQETIAEWRMNSESCVDFL